MWCSGTGASSSAPPSSTRTASSSRARAARRSSAARAESDLSRYQIPGRVLSRQASAQPSAKRRYGHAQRGRVSVSVTKTGPFRPGQPLFKARLHPRPVVVDDGVPRRVSPLAAAHQHVLAEHALELGRERGQRGPRARVRRLRLELDAEVALVLERMLQEEVLRLGIGAARPRVGNEPRIADLDPASVRPVLAVARVADETIVEVVREAHLDRRVPLVESLHRLIGADTLERPDARIARDREQLVMVLTLERF